jgi:hypothetical protein
VSTISPRPAASDRVDIVQESWKPVGGPGLPAFQNKWVNYGGEWNTAAYFMDSLGTVHLRRLIQNPDLKNTHNVIDSIIFTLPQGYRPQAGSVHLVASGYPTQPDRAPTPARGRVEMGHQGFSPLAIFGRVDVMADGNVVARYGKPPEYLSLEGISFRVK